MALLELDTISAEHGKATNPMARYIFPAGCAPIVARLFCLVRKAGDMITLDRDTFFFIAAAVAAGIVLAVAALMIIAAILAGLAYLASVRARVGVWLDGPGVDGYRVAREIAAEEAASRTEVKRGEKV